MFVVTLDMRACVPYFIATKKRKKHKVPAMTLYVGTSGFSYKEWKGSFYPENISAGEMLSYYAARLPAVELNNTYYRLPPRSTVESWRAQVPENFQFSVKA